MRLERWLYTLPLRARSLFRRRRVDLELDEEIRFHVEEKAQQLMAGGTSSAEAHEAAMREFGGVEQVKERCRDTRRVRLLQDLLQDLRHGLRLLRKSPGFTFVAGLTMALGIGANTAIFSVINGVLLSPPPYKNPQEIVVMQENESLPNVAEIRRQMSTASASGAINVTPMDYTSGPEPVQIRVGQVDAGYLRVLGVEPMLGRALSDAEDVRGGPRVVVVSHAFWRGHLGSDPEALGKTIALGGNPYVVIGVMPMDFVCPREHADVFISLWAGDPGAAAERDVHFMHTYWRLRERATLAEAQAEISTIDRRLAAEFPDEEARRSTHLIPLRESLVGDVRPALLVLFCAVGLVLLIACANFTSLLMARTFARRQEMTLRAALGAGRGRLVRGLLTESALLAMLGGAAGWLLAKWGTRVLLALAPERLVRLNGVQMDTRVLVFALLVSTTTGIVFGMAPAFLVARGDVAGALKESGRRATASPVGHRLRQVLVASELALALVLLAGAGLLVKGFWRLRSVDPGFNAAGLLTMYVQLPEARYGEIARQSRFRRDLLARLDSLPGVQAGLVSDIPLGGNYVGHGLVIDGRPPIPVGTEPEVQTISVMGGYFRVMQVPVRAGRDFTEGDREERPLVAVVNEETVRRFFPHDDPVGARIHWAREIGAPRWMTIVGVVGDVKQAGLNQPVDPAVYTPFVQTDERWRRFMTLAIRARQPYSAAFVEEVKRQVWSVDPQIPVSDVQTMEELMAVSLAEQRFNVFLLGSFAALALILAGVGIYGLIAYSTSQRAHEIGIRMALGGRRGDVLRLIMGEGARLALAGVVGGMAGALALTRLMTSLLFEVKATDPAVFGGVALLLMFVALAACGIPALRATRVDPIDTLRYE